MNEWFFTYEGYDPKEQGLREALLTLGNAYFATRGANEETSADGVNYPGTYLAGGYNRLTTKIRGKDIENEDLVNLPNWLCLKFRIAGDEDWFDPRNVELETYFQQLDIKKALLTRNIRYSDSCDRKTDLHSRRFVHMSNPHLAGQELTITAENWSGEIEISSAIDGTVRNQGVKRYGDLNDKHLDPIETGSASKETIYLKCKTNQSEIQIAESARTRLFLNDQPLEVYGEVLQEQGYIAHHFKVNLKEGDRLRVEKIVSLYTSKDMAITEAGHESRKALERAGDFEELLAEHIATWDYLWYECNILFEKSEESEQPDSTAVILNLYTFHLLQTSSLNTRNIDAGVPSRGWHGEAYRGHIFWDELFIFPFLSLRLPNITRSLLMYRYRRLNEARGAAREEGYRGAMFPWQSGSNGREESQKIHLNPQSGNWIPDFSNHQRHVNSAIAYNIIEYYQATNDSNFLSAYGAEMVFEIARFWASKSEFNQDTGRYEILNVMGPDEYHDQYPDSDQPGLNNSSYTNVMAVYVLNEALKLFDVLPEDRLKYLCQSLKLGQKEIEQWKDICGKMMIPFHDDGIISQFEGYEKLKEFDWNTYREKYDNIQRLDRILESEGDDINRYKASKQADVLMLFYLFSAEQLDGIFKQLGYEFDHETIPKNIEYYINRTSHGSTLSWVVHAWVLARADRSRSWELFREALKSDVCDIQGGTTPEGIHLGAMAGTVDLIQRGYTGIEPRGDVLWFNPALPNQLKKIGMRIQYRGQSVDLTFNHKEITIAVHTAAQAPIKIGYHGEIFRLCAGETKVIHLE